MYLSGERQNVATITFRLNAAKTKRNSTNDSKLNWSKWHLTLNHSTLCFPILRGYVCPMLTEAFGNNA